MSEFRTRVKNLEDACAKAMTLAAKSPGRYGGRYVARKGKNDFVVLDNDDPASQDSDDVYAHVTPTQVNAMGHARYYLGKDGKVDRTYFEE